MSKLKKIIIGFIATVLFVVTTLFIAGLIDSRDDPSRFIDIDYVQDSGETSFLELTNGIYIGDVASRNMNGSGRIVFETGSHLEAKFTSGKIVGEAVLVIPGIGTYVGEFKDNKRNGEGTLTYENGDVLKCNWIDDEPFGTIILTYANGAILSGEYYYSEFTTGTYVVKENGVKITYYIGTEDLNLGKVTFETSDGTKATGYYSNGKLNGECNIEYADGNNYVGNFENGKRSGEGTFTWSDGSVYQGNWEEDKMNGTGIYYWENDNKSLKGIWKNNKATDNMTLKYEDNTYTATFKDGKCTKIVHGER